MRCNYSLQAEKAMCTDGKLWEAFHAAAESIKDCVRSGKTAVKVSAIKLFTDSILLYSSSAVASTGIPPKEVRSDIGQIR